MSNNRDAWWGYIREIMRRYPKCALFEQKAIEQAISYTKGVTCGYERMKLINAVFFDKTHTLAGAAMLIPCSYETAKRWQQQFIREVAKGIRCNGLIEQKKINQKSQNSLIK